MYPEKTPVAEKAISGTVVEAVPNTDPNDLNLKTKAWTGGAGKVEGTIYVADKAKVLTTGTLAANGTFTLVLPESVADADLTSESFDNTTPISGDPSGLTCTGNVNVSDPAARLAALNVRVDAAKDGSITPGTATGSINDGTKMITFGIKSGVLLYVDRALTLKGSQACQGTQNGMTVKSTGQVDAKLVKGWNKVMLNMDSTATATAMTSTVTMTSGSLPTNEWVFANSMMPMNVRSMSALPQFNLFR